MNTEGKLSSLREIMLSQDIQACIIPTTDPHISEYTPAYWKTREWLSGFDGSAGTLVVTSDKAGLWTDSRYFLQAEKQLQGSSIDLFKMGLPETPTIQQWLVDNLKENDVVGIEGEVFEASEAQALFDLLSKNNLKLNTSFAPYCEIWQDRPSIPEGKVFVLSEVFSGQSVQERISILKNRIKTEGGNTTILASLDQIAWLFNLRGTDIPYNPTVVAYASVSEKETVLFINPRKLSSEVIEYLQSQGVILGDYTKINDYIRSFSKENRVVIAPNKINYKLYSEIKQYSTEVPVNVHPIDFLKAVKNKTEIENMRDAMKKDGVALVRFLIWLENSMASGEEVTEIKVAEMLRQFRSEQTYYFSESFSTIAGYNEHGAIVHYEATEESNAVVLPQGLLLLDSGAQYFGGTTDITRTISVGKLSDEMRKDYTNVLKGNIQLSMAKFPKGTVGMQLDVLARQFLWKEGENYLHGTGHGVGYFLNVHEGPQSIRMNYNPVALIPGMITSNEPGLYKAGQYGIRIENLLLTVDYKTTSMGEFYAFETLTLCPIDTFPINRSMMSEDEIVWLNSYHEKVFSDLSPLLSQEESSWLKEKTKAI
ncbi:aminopeptidase P family protein [Bacteroidales bacterium OttesenSCG-928-M11]|nr:aminopeptidase P family protein [Bacteroidales bacterium OttesenSCG-928-M11]